MIKFRQKNFAEYDAMRSLYVEIMKRAGYDKKDKFPIINSSALIPILRGNNVVVERFVITTSIFGRDKYRMYLKIGAKAKLPDEVRLPASYYEETLGNVSLEVKGGMNFKNFSSVLDQKLFDNNNWKKNKKKKNNNNNNGGGGGTPISSKINLPGVHVKYTVEKLLGEAVKYSKSERSLVLEFDSIDDAIRALNILPFGMNYKIYLLDA